MIIGNLEKRIVLCQKYIIPIETSGKLIEYLI